MLKKASVVVVEDNDDMRKAVCGYLRFNGYTTYSSSSAEEALENNFHSKGDVAVFDIALPGKSGIELVNIFKERGFDGPIIGLTARDTVDDKLAGLESGMDDYIVKPFDLRELTARINAQMRAKNSHHDLANVICGKYKIEPKRHKFYVNEKEVKLTLVEFRLMLKLMQNNHATVTNQDLIESAWGEDANTTNPPIRIHISNLRSKINDTSLTIIQTVPGVGYIFNG